MQEQVLNISPIVVWVIALSQLLTFGLTVYNLFAAGGRANTRKLDEHEVRLTAHDQRLGAIEIVQRAMPTKDNMHELEIAMERLKGEMKTMSQVMVGNQQIMERLESIVGRHEAHLLDGGKR